MVAAIKPIMKTHKVGVLGASSMLGKSVIAQLISHEYDVFAFTRKLGRESSQRSARWCVLGNAGNETPVEGLRSWICLCPIWAVSEHFDLLKRSGARRVVALSSTSRFTKMADAGSADPYDNALAHRLAQGEQALAAWAEQNAIEWVVLRPTLIYDLATDKNLAQIANFIRRYGFFPLLGGGQGLRQPVHVTEVAAATIAALESPNTANKDYNISGGETLTYGAMVERVFKWLGRKPRFFRVPLAGFALAIYLARIFPRYRHLSGAMAQRMNQDLIFDHSTAKRDFGYSPNGFLSKLEM